MSILVPSEYKWRNDDLGFTTYSNRPPIDKAFRDIECGVNYGYPLCCVLEYAFDIINGRHPAIRRGTVPDGNGGVYVPCSRCCEEIGREYAV